jgi:hypothetical protein
MNLIECRSILLFEASAQKKEKKRPGIPKVSCFHRQPGHLVFQDPLLSVPALRRVWLYRSNIVDTLCEYSFVLIKAELPVRSNRGKAVFLYD